MTRVKKTAGDSEPEITPVQDPELSSFFLRLRKRNTDDLAHKQTVDSFFQYWERDRDGEVLMKNDEVVEVRRGKAAKLTNHFYDMVTDFYEYGWGYSFHFARMFKDQSFAQSIAQHELYLALKLGLKKGMECLDVGCGVGGPMREIARFSEAFIIGLNNNQYQVERCRHLAEEKGLAELCSTVKGDFTKMPLPANSVDAAYALEATCHAPRLEQVYGEIFRVLRPGSSFACYEWCTTDRYDESDPVQKKIIRDLEEGNSISKLYTVDQCLQALKTVGFEIVEWEDLASPDSGLQKAQDPWYLPLKGSYSLKLDNLNRWRMTPMGRWFTDRMVSGLETVRLAPSGTRKVSSLLNLAADNLVKGGEMHIFTPMLFFLARKPAKGTKGTASVGH